jgi:quinol monooxygenase YgiN
VHRFGLPRIIASLIARNLHASPQEDDMQSQPHTHGLAITAIWEAKPGEEAAVANILAQLGAKAREEPGVRLFLVHRNVSNPVQFLFYELFEDEAAFAAHQQTPHFKDLVLEQGLPRLTKRERTQYALL